MKKYIVPGFIKSLLTEQTPEEIANLHGYTVDQINICMSQCDTNSMKPFLLSDLKPKQVKTEGYGSLSFKSPLEIQKILSNHSIEQTAELLSVSPRTVSRYIAKHGLKTSKESPISKPTISELFEHRTLVEIAAFLKVDITRLKEILR